jgi:hypothetical protein
MGFIKQCSLYCTLILLLYSQQLATSHNSEPAESSPRPLTAVCKINFSIALPYMFTPSCHSCILLGFPAERFRLFRTILVVFHMSPICMSVRIVTKSVCYLRHGRLSTRPFALSAGLKLGGFSWNFILGTFMKILEEVQNWLKSVKIIGHCTWMSILFYFILFFAATLNRHKSALFYWNCIGLSVCLSVCPHVGLSALHRTWRIYVKSDIVDFYENV